MKSTWEWHILIKKGDCSSLDNLFQTSKNTNAITRIVNTRFKNETLLATAIKSGFTEIVQLLLKHGADPDLKSSENGRNEPPLITATRWKNIEVVKILVEHGTDLKQTAIYGHDAIFQAVVENAFNILEYLLQISQPENFIHEERNCPLGTALKYSSQFACKRRCLAILMRHKYRCSCVKATEGFSSSFVTSVLRTQLTTSLRSYYCSEVLTFRKESNQVFIFEPFKLFNLARNVIIKCLSCKASAVSQNFCEVLKCLQLPNKLKESFLCNINSEDAYTNYIQLNKDEINNMGPMSIILSL